MWTGFGNSPEFAASDPMAAPDYQLLWTNALPYLGVRQNDEHTRYCVRFARTLLQSVPARAEVVIPAIMLHDVGWSTVPEDKILQSFGPRTMYPELRRRHEVEGVRIARELLTLLGYDPALIDAVAAIIDGHDTRDQAQSSEDAVVRDADKLWRYTRFGLDTVRGWFGHSVAEQLLLLGTWTESRFATEPGRQMALGLLAALQAEAIPGLPA